MKNKKPLVSVIINCFNGEKFLEEALNSVINQTYKNWEIIFWDNQSTDKSIQILKRYLRPNIRYFYAKKFTQLGEARELAFAKSKGDWIAFLDCDDIWYLNKLKEQIDIVTNYNGNLGLVYSKCEIFCDVIKNKKKLFRRKAIQPFKGNLQSLKINKELFNGNFIPFPSILYKKQAIIDAGKFSCYKFSPDYYLNLYISLNYEVYGLNKILCLYRFHDSNLSKSIREIGILEAINIIYRITPKFKADILSRTHKIRYVLFLITRLNIKKAYKYLLEIGLWNSILSIIELYFYFIKFKTKI